MSAVLGIDAAWTYDHPSGVALVRQTGSGQWEAVAVDDSYQAFLGRLQPCLVDQAATEAIPVRELIETAGVLAGVDVTRVAADIPLATEPVLARRRADNLISERFGRLGCSTHSPSRDRPGRISEEIRDCFQECGFQLATNANRLPERALIETFPHPALLSLMKTRFRVPYKVGNSRKYWPGCDRAARLA